MLRGFTMQSRPLATGLNRPIRGLALLAAMLLTGCTGQRAPAAATIEFTRVPPADKGGPEIVDAIEGRVLGARPGQQIVLFVRNSGVWWVQPGPDQPFPDQPYTPVQTDATWRSSTQLGSDYA